MPDLNERWTRSAPWLIALLAVAAWLPPLGLHDYWFPDEPDVALPVVEMLARGDWVVPTANGLPWLDYPPLTYWGGLLWSHLLGGASPFALRLTPLLAGAVFLVATASIARQVAGRRAAWYAALVGIATPLVWMQATTLQVDMCFAGTQALGFALYLASDARSGRAAGMLRVAAFVAFGLAMLAKGPLGLLLPGLILTVWHAWNGEWRRILWLAPLALVAAAVTAIWYVPLVQRLGATQVGHEYWLQNFDRFGTTTRGHGGKGTFYYFINLANDLGPWTLLLAAALWQSWRDRAQRGVRLLGLWFVVSIVFLSLASTKRSVYLLPAYPAILALVGWWLTTRMQIAWLRASLWFTAAVFALGAAGFVGWRWTHLAQLPHVVPLLPLLGRASYTLAALFGGGALIIALQLRRERVEPALRACAAVLFLAYVAAMWLVMPVIDSVRNHGPAAAWIALNSVDRGPVGFFLPGREGTKRAGWLIYLKGRHLEFLPDSTAAHDWLGAVPGRMVLADPVNSPPVPGTRVAKTWTIGDQDWVLLMADRVPPPAP